MSQSLLDDLARLSATPMSRAQALRLMGGAIVGAVVASWSARTLKALSCAATTCSPPFPDLCCIDFPTNPNASINTCCTSTDRCCKFFTPEGGSFASVTCCRPTQVCRKLNPPMEAAYCEDCAPNTFPCGLEPCCPSAYTCISGNCCPPEQVCGAVCCSPTEACVNGTCSPNTGACQFTDDPLMAGTTPIKAVHITELRSCINLRRAQFGRSPFAFTDASLTGVAVKTVHIVQLRAALLGAYVAAGQTVPVYTDPTLIAQQTVVRVVHIHELRAAALALN